MLKRDHIYVPNGSVTALHVEALFWFWVRKIQNAPRHTETFQTEQTTTFKKKKSERVYACFVFYASQTNDLMGTITPSDLG